ncbi:hypothetical protein ACQKMN_17025 [Ureibacillus composti]
MASSDEKSLSLAMTALKKLGCPNVVIGEGNKQFIPFGKSDSFKTPDLIAGPNNGDEFDFYIDVHSPTGSILTRDRSPLSEMSKDMTMQINSLKKEELGSRLKFEVSKYEKDYFPEVANPFKKKINKYGDLRNSPLFGFVGIFDGTGNEIVNNIPNSLFIDVVLAQYADYIFKHLHQIFKDSEYNKIVPILHSNLHSGNGELIRISVPINNLISFYLLLGYGSSEGKGLLLVNQSVLDSDKYKNHPVITWLKSVISIKGIVKVPTDK